MDRSLYSRPDKRRTLIVRRRQEEALGAPLALPEPVAVDRHTECHITPPDVAARMINYLGSLAGCTVLEPSAGNGALITSAFSVVQRPRALVAVEREISLYHGLQQRFDEEPDMQIIQGCFLDYASWLGPAQRFQKIVMNPPFRSCRVHLTAALSLLDDDSLDGATLVALVPDVDSSHAMNYSAEVLERLPAGTFVSTDVRTRIIRFKS